MRIGLVVTGGVDRSGTERVIPSLLYLIERLARRHDVHVFALHHSFEPCTYEFQGAIVHDLGRVRAPRGLGRFARARRLKNAVADVGGFDVLHAFQALPAGHAATVVARRINVPCIVTFNSGEWVTMPEIGYGLQRRWRDRQTVQRVAAGASLVTVCTRVHGRSGAPSWRRSARCA